VSLKATVEPAVKPVPVIVTCVSSGPVIGAKLVIVCVGVQLLHVAVCDPKFEISSCGFTIHSLSVVFVPAEAAQSVLGLHTVLFLTSVLFLVARAVPATAHPDPGSGPYVPTASIKVSVPLIFLANPTASSPFHPALPLV